MDRVPVDDRLLGAGQTVSGTGDLVEEGPAAGGRGLCGTGEGEPGGAVRDLVPEAPGRQQFRDPGRVIGQAGDQDGADAVREAERKGRGGGSGDSLAGGQPDRDRAGARPARVSGPGAVARGGSLPTAAP